MSVSHDGERALRRFNSGLCFFFKENCSPLDLSITNKQGGENPIILSKFEGDEI